ncbi:MAG: alpha/beta hydrolase [Pseudomonadota bacterium]
MRPPAPIVVDPALFHDDAIAPDTRALNAAIEDLLSQAPTIIEIGPEAVRARRREGTGGPLDVQPAHPMARWETAKDEHREVPVRIFHPGRDLKGIYLHIHGGGLVLGAADAQDQTLAAMAERLSIGIASVEYRLAPEHPYPAPHDDCETAALWVVQKAKSLFGTDRIVIGGESGGANLSAVTILRLRDRHGIMPFAGANLIYGQYDVGGTPSVHTWGSRNLILNTEIITYFRDQAFPPEIYGPGDYRDPEVSPLFKPLHDLCPALFTVGTLDPLIDDSILMASRWAAAGNATELDIYPGGIHVFDMFPDLSIAREANARMDRFIESVLT